MQIGLQGFPSAFPVRWAARRAEAARDRNAAGRGGAPRVADVVRRQLVRRSAPARRLPAQRCLGAPLGAPRAHEWGLAGALGAPGARA